MKICNRVSLFTLIVLSALALTACGKRTEEPAAENESATSDAPVAEVTAAADCPVADAAGNIAIAPGLSARIITKGYGRAATVGDFADTNVWLWLYDEAAEDRHGEFVWESGNDVFQFQLGRGQVIKGWDLGVPCMLEGETRELVVASDLAYGAAGRGTIPPHAPLIFTIELVGLTSPE